MKLAPSRNGKNSKTYGKRLRSFTAAVLTVLASATLTLAAAPAAHADVPYCADSISTSGDVVATQHCITSINTSAGVATVSSITADPILGIHMATYGIDGVGTFQVFYANVEGIEVFAVASAGLTSQPSMTFTISGRTMPVATVGLADNATMSSASDTLTFTATPINISLSQVLGTSDNTTMGISALFVDGTSGANYVPFGNCLDAITAAGHGLYMFSNNLHMLYSWSSDVTNGSLDLMLPTQLSATDTLNLSIPNELLTNPACGWSLDPTLDTASQLKATLQSTADVSGSMAFTIDTQTPGYVTLHLTPTPVAGSPTITANDVVISRIDLSKPTTLLRVLPVKVKAGKSIALPAASSGKTVTWSSRTPKVCTVSGKPAKGYPNGKLTTKKAGSCIVSASAPNVRYQYTSLYSTFTVKVTR